MLNFTARKVATLKESGMYGDADGLYLRVGPTGAKSWILRTVVHGRRRELGLGAISLISLAEARETARGLRKVARAGGEQPFTFSPLELHQFVSDDLSEMSRATNDTASSPAKVFAAGMHRN